MSTKRVKGFAALHRVLQKDMRARSNRLDRAFRRTAAKGAAVMRRNVPVAHSELRDSIHVEGRKIIADAPHAAAVDQGSRPHMPPIEPLIKWVKLRGAQGLSSPKSLGRLSGTTTHEHASSVAAQLRKMSKPAFNTRIVRPGRRMVEQGGDATSVDAPTQIAWAIAMAIAKHGTKPHHYVAKTMPQVMAILDEEIAAALPDKE